MTPAKFLAARLDEAEAIATAANLFDEQLHAGACGWRLGEGMETECSCDAQKRALADIEAKRAIIRDADTFARLAADPEAGDTWRNIAAGLSTAADRAVGHLAAVHAGHPDYDPTWLLVVQ